MGGCIDLIISTVWLVLFIHFRSVNYSLLYLCMQIAMYVRMYVRMYVDVNYFVAVCMYVYARIIFLILIDMLFLLFLSGPSHPSDRMRFIVSIPTCC
jgi:hypothetical protein